MAKTYPNIVDLGRITSHTTVAGTVQLKTGEKAKVENVGTVKDPILKFYIPQGERGIQGEKGDPFTLTKIYTSYDEMVGDFYNKSVQEGALVMISDDTDPERNTSVYVKSSDKFNFITKLSQLEGIKGEQGPRGIPGEQGPKGDRGDTLRIKTTYPSVDDMIADLFNEKVPVGSLVLITGLGDPEDPDTGSLYEKRLEEFVYLTDLSGPQGKTPELHNAIETVNFIDGKIWKGSRAEYDALGEKDENTTYIILDETNISPTIVDSRITDYSTWSSRKIKDELIRISTPEGMTPVSEIDDGVVSKVATWSSSKVLQRVREAELKGELLDDEKLSTTKTWTSKKIRDEIDKIPITPIEDRTTSPVKVWSSKKSIEYIDSKLDPTVIVKDYDVGEHSTWSSKKIKANFDKIPVPEFILDDKTPSISKAWSSSKTKSVIDALPPPETLLYDDGVGDKKTWSSFKIKHELDRVAGVYLIDDSVTARDRVWSSSKTETTLDALVKAEVRVESVRAQEKEKALEAKVSQLEAQLQELKALLTASEK